MITKSKSFYRECKKHASDANKLMEKHFDNPNLEILVSDNLLDYNEGYLNIQFHGEDSSESFLFIDGVFEGTSYC